MRYAHKMSSAARRFLDEILALPHDEQLAIASAVLANVDGAVDEDWDAAWAEELRLRETAATQRGTPPADWSEARARISQRLKA